MIELSISVPFLLFFIAGVVDLSGWLNSHITASRVSYELVRYAAAMPGLDENSPSQPGEMVERAHNLLSRYNAENTTGWTLTKFDDSNSVSVSVTMQHNFIFYPSSTSVNASARSAYLYSTN